MGNDKRWQDSSTIKRNIMAAAVTCAIAIASAALLYVDAFGFSPEVAAGIGFVSTIVVALGNIAQRFVTKTGVK